MTAFHRKYQVYERSVQDQGYSWQNTTRTGLLLALIKGKMVRRVDLKGYQPIEDVDRSNPPRQMGKEAGKNMYPPVQQTWLFSLPWKMQTVINQALRAPDTHFCPNVKIVCRWMRSVVLRNADQEHTFMCSKDEIPSIEALENELNYCSMHFTTHFLYGLEIIGYKHPDSEIALIAYTYYKRFVEELLHFKVESKRQMEVRLADNAEVPGFFEEFSEMLLENLNIKDKKHEEPRRCPANDNYLYRG